MNTSVSYSLAKKLTIASIAITAAFIVTITVIVFLTIVSFGDMFLNNALNEKSEFIQKTFTEPIWTYDQYQIDEIGQSLLVNSEYTYISALKIESFDHRVLFERTQPELKGMSFHQISGMPHTKWKLVNVFKGNELIGRIWVVMTNKGYIDAFKHQFLIILISSILLLLLLTQLVRFYFHKTLTVPMNKILKQVKKIQNEDYSPSQMDDLPLELESIGQALNHAAGVIEKRNNDIMYYTNDLEDLVKDRTAALENQMAKNLNTARLVAVGEMAADVAHEINNPLTVIDLHVTKIKKHEAEGHVTPELSQSIDKIQVMVKRIVKIIKGLKSLSRDGNADPFQPFSVSTMMDDVKMLVEMKIKSHEIKFDIYLPEKTLYALGREVQVSQVLVNLIGNAVDAIIANEGEKWISVEIEEKDDLIEFKVTDSGKGIPVEIREKIMRPFFTTKDVNKGTGLGLSISKSIVEEHGGELVFNSKHANTQFIFTLKKSKLERLTA